MSFIKTAIVGFSLAALAGCSTTTYRSIEEMEIGDDKFIIKYGETVVSRGPFNGGIISRDQKFAKCNEQGGSLQCTNLPIFIDGTPLVNTVR